jgi:hypothetical protein
VFGGRGEAVAVDAVAQRRGGVLDDADPATVPNAE